jgi:hypothetical protein
VKLLHWCRRSEISATLAADPFRLAASFIRARETAGHDKTLPFVDRLQQGREMCGATNPGDALQPSQTGRVL